MTKTIFTKSYNFARVAPSLKHGYSKPKCHNLHNVQLIFVSDLRTVQTSLRIFLQTRIKLAVAKFNSHDSGGHF